MEILSNQELNNINGGGKSIWYFFGGFCTLLVGLVTGFVNSRSCN